MSFHFKNKSNKERHSPPSASQTSSTNMATEDDKYAEIIEEIKKVYKAKIKPIEVAYNFEGFHSTPLTDSDIDAKPIVLLIGQYSTGKTTFIKYLLGGEYTGAHIGVEPTTDRFVAVMHGNQERVIPGNAAAVDHDLPFEGLNSFGQAFLSRFQVSQNVSPLLKNMTIIDTPGILAGDKQLSERGYNFTKVIEWFAQRADLILLMFDSHKLDISNEFKSAIYSLKGQEEKVRVVLNKSDMVSQQQLMRVYGAMMWSLGKVVQTPEVMRVYITSFWFDKPPNCFEDSRELIEAESKDLLQDLKDLNRNAVTRKVNEIIKRARLARVHALIISHLKGEMPSLLGKKKKQTALLNNLALEFKKIQQEHHLSNGDFPNPERFKQNLSSYEIDKFKPFKKDLFEEIDGALSSSFPRLLSKLPAAVESRQIEKNPFQEKATGSLIPPACWNSNSINTNQYLTDFKTLGGHEKGNISGADLSEHMRKSELNTDTLAQIWRLSDGDMNKAGFSLFIVHFRFPVSGLNKDWPARCA